MATEAQVIERKERLMIVRKEFQVHRLNEQGLAKADSLASVFSEALDKIEGLAGSDGREMVIVRTKMEEASYYSKRAMAQRPENQQQ